LTEKIVNWAYSHVLGFPEIKFVLVMLAADSNSEGNGNTSLRQLSRDTDIEEDKLPGILHSLENFGLVYSNIDTDGTVRYRLMIKKLGARHR
jgi:hypothetical protein